MIVLVIWSLRCFLIWWSWCWCCISMFLTIVLHAIMCQMPSQSLWRHGPEPLGYCSQVEDLLSNVVSSLGATSGTDTIKGRPSRDRVAWCDAGLTTNEGDRRRGGWGKVPFYPHRRPWYLSTTTLHLLTLMTHMGLHSTHRRHLPLSKLLFPKSCFTASLLSTLALCRFVTVAIWLIISGITRAFSLIVFLVCASGKLRLIIFEVLDREATFDGWWHVSKKFARSGKLNVQIPSA